MFVKDTRAENLLTGFGVDWTYSNNMKISQLVAGWENHNAGRRRPVNDEVTQEYALRMENGEHPPAVILRKTCDVFDVLDGIQRLVALTLIGGTAFSAYIVETDSETMAECIRVLANPKLAGHREDLTWELSQAISILINQRGCSTAEVARWLGLKEERVVDEKSYLDWSFEIRRIGGPQSMKKGVVAQVAEFAKLHDFSVASKPIAEFLHDLNTAKFTNGESGPYIEKFFDGLTRKSKSKLFDQYSERLSAFRDDPEVITRMEGRKSSKRTPEIKLRQALRACLSVAKDVAKSGCDICYMEEFYQIWNQVNKELKRIDKKAAHEQEVAQ